MSEVPFRSIVVVYVYTYIHIFISRVFLCEFFSLWVWDSCHYIVKYKSPGISADMGIYEVRLLGGVTQYPYLNHQVIQPAVVSKLRKGMCELHSRVSMEILFLILYAMLQASCLWSSYPLNSLIDRGSLKT